MNVRDDDAWAKKPRESSRMMIEDKALLAEYVSESEELLDSLALDLEALCDAWTKPGKSKSARGPALVNRLFRAVHSLKGLLGMMGLPELQSVTHEFEDILDDLRLDNISLDRDSASVLREAGGVLAGLVGAAVRGTLTDDDLDRMRALLTAFGRGSSDGSGEDQRNVSQLDLSEKERDLITSYERRRISENLKAGRAFYAITAQFSIDDLDRLYNALASKLNGAGEHITTLPAAATDAAMVALKLVFATRLKEAELLAALKGFGVKIERLMGSRWRRAGEAIISVGRGKRREPVESGTAFRVAEAAKAVGGDHPGTQEPIQVRQRGRAASQTPALSQESLRPLSPSVRVELAQVDLLSSLAHELALETEKLSSLAGEVVDAAEANVATRFHLKQRVRRIKRQFLALEERLVELRMVSLTQTFTRASRLASKLARELGKSVQVEVSGRDTQLDKTIVDRIADPLYHILRNAVDHGIESPTLRKIAGKKPAGKVIIESRLEGARAIVSVSDDGAGIDVERVRRRAVEIGAISGGEELSDEETVRLIFRPGFSTAEEVSAVSGRGVGLDAVEKTIFDLGGEIRVTSEKGKGAKFELVVPTTLVMISAFIVKSGGWRYAVNVSQIVELIQVEPASIAGSDGRRRVMWRQSRIPLVELSFLLGLGGARPLFPGDSHPNGGGRIDQRDGSLARIPALITRIADRPVAIAVEQFESQKEIIVKSLGSLARKMKGVLGAVDLEEGDVALVLDLPALLLMKSVRV